VAGKPNAIADDGAACCLRWQHVVDVFTDRGTSVDAAHSVTKGGRYELHAVSICSMGKAYNKDHEKSRHIRLRGGGCGNRLLAGVVLHHIYVTQRVAEVLAVSHKDKGFSGSLSRL